MIREEVDLLQGEFPNQCLLERQSVDESIHQQNLESRPKLLIAGMWELNPCGLSTTDPLDIRKKLQHLFYLKNARAREGKIEKLS